MSAARKRGAVPPAKVGPPGGVAGRPPWRAEPPPIHHGGILAEQMGLGKTIETIALILRNKRVPPTAAVRSAAAEGHRRPKLPGITKGMTKPGADPQNPSPKHEGGTLVICTVSLVGQWIREIKDKLVSIGENTGSGVCPVSIYCYHGPSRKKCAALLASYDVVITTYSIVGTERGTCVKEADVFAKSRPWVCTATKDGQSGTGPGNHRKHYAAVCGHNNVVGAAVCSKWRWLWAGTQKNDSS